MFLKLEKMSSSPHKRQYKAMKSQLEHILHRPDTYVGSGRQQTFTDSHVGDITSVLPKIKNCSVKYIPAMLRIFVEIVSNAIDNIYRSEEEKVPMSKIKVTIDQDTGLTTVYNDGGWIPLDTHVETGKPIPELIFGVLLTSDNYDDQKQRSGSGRNGYGAKLTNAFSTMFKIEICVPKDDHFLVYRQEWSNNMRDCKKSTVTRRKVGPPSTCVSWTPDFERFKIKGYTDDMLSVYYRYIYDTAMIAGCSNVSVYLNKTKLPIGGLKDYSKLFTDSSESLKIETSDSVVVLTPSSTFKHFAFTNGVHNVDGGVHVESWTSGIFKPLLARFIKKNQPKISLNELKSFFSIFIKCDLPNPEFSSQSKTYLTVPSPKVNVSKKNIDTLMKWSFVTKVKDIIKSKEYLALKKVEKKKKTFQKIDGYDPANKAGSAESHKCSLIFTEGLSAKTYAVQGIEKGVFGLTGRDWFGLFPLRGKLLNVRNAKTTSIAANKEIKNAINAIGLRLGVDYTKDENFKKLNYGKIIILCDADVDGIHIQGLLMNFIHTLFPTLLHRTNPYVVSMETPIVRVFEGKKIHVFYNEQRFKQFIQLPGKQKLRKKYHKGLGTSSNKEVMETFGERMVEYVHDDLADEAMRMVFSSNRSDDRKKWLSDFDPDANVDIKTGSIVQMDLSQFINERMIHFSIDDCGRSIPHLLDGLKESQRKVLYAVFKKKLSYKSKTLKVNQLAGFTAEHTGYHHGEQCLYDTIINLATDIMGKNNIPYLYRDGQFGSRLDGGKDASAGRYIFTKEDMLTRKLFIPSDDNLLPRNTDDGEPVEPRFYVPIIPTALVNGCQAGIGTGWSCSLPLYNPLDLVSSCKKWIKNQTLPELSPWYRGFKGVITRISPTKFSTSGLMERKNDTVTITELPIGVWTNKYKSFLEDLLEKKFIKKLSNYSTPKEVKFVIKEHRNGMKCTMENLKLINTVTTSNMVLFTPKGKLKKFDTVNDIITSFCMCRLRIYEKRKATMIKNYNKQLRILKNKSRFLEEVMTESLVIFRRPEKDICADLEDRNYDKDEKETYDYLLNLGIRSVSQDKINELRRKIADDEEKLQTLEDTTEKQMWLTELNDFTKHYKAWLKKH